MSPIKTAKEKLEVANLVYRAWPSTDSSTIWTELGYSLAWQQELGEQFVNCQLSRKQNCAPIQNNFVIQLFKFFI